MYNASSVNGAICKSPWEGNIFPEIETKVCRIYYYILHIPNPRTHQHKTINKQIVCLLLPELMTNIDAIQTFYLSFPIVFFLLL